jgi:hypothetical protein
VLNVTMSKLGWPNAAAVDVELELAALGGWEPILDGETTRPHEVPALRAAALKREARARALLRGAIELRSAVARCLS